MSKPSNTPISEYLQGCFLVGSQDVKGSYGRLVGRNPRTGEELLPEYGMGGAEDVERAAELAAKAFPILRQISSSSRAAFLERIAHELEAAKTEIIARVELETGIASTRAEAEFARTTKQLVFFANVVRDGHWIGARLDPGRVEHPLGPRPDIRVRNIPLGPVAVFSASNFPLAFSVAGGDTASAFAAGCPVIVKGHSSHPGVSELVAIAVRSAVEFCNLPEGTFSLLLGTGRGLGAKLVAHPEIKAVGFTGSRSGGTALADIASKRPEPIPVYAEMSSTNPIFVLPKALGEGSERLAKDFITSVNVNAGQMCTCPGLLFAIKSPALEQFLAAAAEAIRNSESAPMISADILSSFENAVDTVAGRTGVVTLATGTRDPSIAACGIPHLFTTDGETFLSDPMLRNEAFGVASLVVQVANFEQMVEIARNLEGQLTASVHATSEESEHAQILFAELELNAGRLIANGWPTGVEVGHSMVHGGPFPATLAPATTSVGSLAINRFLRPISYQNFPGNLLPEELINENPRKLWRLVDGQPTND
jgi:alpha-ketoglutaric semialdehyde dehydrogenase